MANTADLVTIDIDQLTVNIRDIPGMFTFHVCIRDANTDERGIYNILQRENIPVLSQGQGEVTWVKFFDLHPHPTNSFHEGQFLAFVIILDKEGSQIAEGVSEPFHLTEGAIKFIRETYAANYPATSITVTEIIKTTETETKKVAGDDLGIHIPGKNKDHVIDPTSPQSPITPALSISDVNAYALKETQKQLAEAQKSHEAEVKRITKERRTKVTRTRLQKQQEIALQRQLSEQQEQIEREKEKVTTQAAAHERERQRDQDILATAQKQLREANERAAQTVANPAPTTGTAPPPATAPAAAQEETPRQENAPRRAAAAPSLITAWFRVFGTRRLSPISIIIIILLLLVIAFLINETAPSQSQEEPDHVNMEKEAAMKKVIAPIPIPTTKKVTVGKDNDLSFTVPNTPQDGGATATINTLNNSQFGDNALIEVNNKIEITDNRQTIVHPNGWPIDWKPTLPTVLASALPAGVYTFVLPPRGVQCIQVPEGCYVEPAQEDMLRIDVKYGTDNTCFDYGIGAPGQEVSGTQIRFRPKAFESGDVTVRIHIKPF